MFGDFLVAIFVFFYMFILDYKIAIISFLLVPLDLTFLFFSIRKIEKLENKNNNALFDMVSLFVEFIRGMPILKNFGKNDVLQKDLKEKTYLFANTSKTLSANKAKELSIYNFILDLGYFSIILVASISAFYNKIDVFKFIILAIISKEFYRPFHNMDMYYMYYVLALDSYKRLKKTFSERPIYDNKNGNVPKSSNICFDAVSFKYENNSFALKDLNFEIREREITALVGESGAGKSTITNLLLRFYDVAEGKITIDGIDIREIPYDELLKRVGLVLQSTQLFNNTIEENIRVGNKNASIEEIIEASKKARLHDFVMSLPDGYNTKVGEDASFLSGGQRQRISIARTFLKDSSILILDEITSNIDVINEELIQEAITELAKNKTVIIVAHRLKTIKNADNILVFKNGSLYESGKHEELMAKGGEYCRLYKTQE
jgi:ABC-type multidrug transport system, ATPase and permease components